MIPPLAAVLLQAGVEPYREHVRAVLRADALPAALGVVVITVGILALALSRFRRGGMQPAPLYFASFAVLYGVRLLLRTSAVPFLLGMPDSLPAFGDAAITFVIPIPAVLFVYDVLPTRRRILNAVLAVAVLSGVTGIAADAVTRRPMSLSAMNNVVAAVIILAFLLVLFRHVHAAAETRTLRAGLLAFFVAALVVNAADIANVRLPFNPEPLGFAALLFALGRVMVRRAIENEERLGNIKKELEIATRIQLSILPQHLPSNAHLRVAARYVPMTAVAGDFYEILKVDEQRAGVLVADVSGHGVPAALIASMVKVAIAAQLPHAGSPAEVLAGMNRTLCGKLQGQFVTAACLFLDSAHRVARYAGAGHPPSLWLRSGTGELQALAENGLLLGLMPSASYTDLEFDIAPGDRFLLYTDGLVEAASESGEFYGDDRLRFSFRAAASLNVEECASAVLDGVAAWSGSRRGRQQDDDLTLVVAEIVPQPY